MPNNLLVKKGSAGFYGGCLVKRRTTEEMTDISYWTGLSIGDVVMKTRSSTLERIQLFNHETRSLKKKKKSV